VLLAVAIRLRPDLIGEANPAGLLLETMVFLNVILAAFNALPIPPLDGSRVADALMPEALRPAWNDLCQLGPIALAAVILLPRFAGVDLFRWPMEAATFLLKQLVTMLGG